MKRIAIVVVLLVLVIACLAVSWMRPAGNKDVSGNGIDSSYEMKTQFTFKFSPEGKFVEMYGRRTSFDIPGADPKDVEVRLGDSFAFNGKKPDAVFLVTIKSAKPAVLTSSAYEKIQIGMTYPQVSEVLGSVMTRGQMSDNFSSRLELIQGKGRIDLTFDGGKVTEKSAKDLD